jgi:uncharacterized protein YndB with AHSA1/START domain
MANPGALKIEPRGEREIVITRGLAAPRDLVWEALSRPELLRRWLLGPPGWTMTVCENDVRVGGAFRHAWKNVDGSELAMHGVYREVVVNERAVRTETFEMGCAPQSGEQIGTMTLTEAAGRTTMTVHVLYPSREARDGALASGMEHGMAASYAKLDELLAAPRGRGAAPGARAP